MEQHGDHHAHDLHHAGTTTEMPFSEEEIKTLHSQDRAAATYVVGLMLVIFGIGVVLYSIVALTVAF